MRRKRSQSPKLNEEATLQITSMADIFTIILVFLLKSTSNSSVNISPSQGMKIPESKSQIAPIEALKVEISENGIQVESKPIVDLQNFRFKENEIQPNATSLALSEALKKERKRQELIAKSNPNVVADSKMILVADERTPYITVKTVLASAAVNGFTDYKLITVNKN